MGARWSSWLGYEGVRLVMLRTPALGLVIDYVNKARSPEAGLTGYDEIGTSKQHAHLSILGRDPVSAIAFAGIGVDVEAEEETGVLCPDGKRRNNRQEAEQTNQA